MLSGKKELPSWNKEVYAFTGGASYEFAPNLTVWLYVYILENQCLMLVLFEKTLRNFVRTSLFRPAQQ